MVKIKVTPEILRDVARRFWRVSDTLARVEVNLNRADNYLDAGELEGNVRWRVENSIGRATSKVRQIESVTNDLARELERIAGNFEQADRQGLQVIDKGLSTAPSFNPQVLPATVAATGVLWQAGQIAGGGDNVTPMNRVYTGLDIKDAFTPIDAGQSALNYMQHLNYKDFQSIGRSMNGVIPVHHSGGWITRMDRFGHVIKNPAFKQVSLIGGIALGSVINYLVDDDTNIRRRVGTAFVQAGMETAIGSTGVGSAILLGNSVVQLGGTLVEGYSNMAGQYYGGEYQEIFTDHAASLNENLDRINLTNFTHDAAHIVVDTFSGDWDQVGDDFGELWGHIKEFPSGISGVQQDVFDIFTTSAIAETDKFVSNLPVPQEWKSTIHDGAISAAHFVDDLVIPTSTTIIDPWSWFYD